MTAVIAVVSTVLCLFLAWIAKRVYPYVFRRNSQSELPFDDSLNRDGQETMASSSSTDQLTLEEEARRLIPPPPPLTLPFTPTTNLGTTNMPFSVPSTLHLAATRTIARTTEYDSPSSPPIIPSSPAILPVDDESLVCPLSPARSIPRVPEPTAETGAIPKVLNPSASVNVDLANDGNNSEIGAQHDEQTPLFHAPTPPPVRKLKKLWSNAAEKIEKMKPRKM